MEGSEHQSLKGCRDYNAVLVKRNAVEGSQSFAELVVLSKLDGNSIRASRVPSSIISLKFLKDESEAVARRMLSQRSGLLRCLVDQYKNKFEWGLERGFV